MIRNKLSLLIICAALATQGQVLCRWTADSSRTTPVEFSCFRGESLLLSPTLASYGTSITNYTATLLWQTNGMGTAWWSTNVLAFTPAMDVGANKYTVFIRAETTNGVNYRANGTITMRNAPGFTPNTLPLPVPSIDFATVNTTNAPWLLAETDPGIPAAIASAVAQAGSNTTAAVATKVSTNDATYLLTVSKAASALQPSSTNNLATTNQLNGYFPLSGGRLNSGATLDIVTDIPMCGLYLTTYGPFSISYGGAGNPLTTLGFPNWFDGEIQTIASREWVANQFYLTAETDSIALGRLTTHTNRTDNPHVVTAAQVGSLTALETTNAIAASMGGNLIVQLTTNKTTSYTFEPTNATYIGQCAETALPAAGTVSVPIGAAGAYPLAWGCTNSTFTSVKGTYVNGQLFCAENEAGDITAKVEIYRRDIVTDLMSEWGDGGATFTVPAGATPQVVPYSVWVPSVDTNRFRVWARIKRVGGSATSARLLIVGSGAGTPTHFSMTVPATVPIASHNADATAHSFILSRLPPSVLTNQLWGALGTNATYRMSWDVTNGTFKVEEILP